MAGQGRARQGGVLLPPGVGLPPFLVQLGDLPCSRSRREGKGREKGRKEGVRPLPLVQFGPDHGEGCGHLLRPFSPFPYVTLRPNMNSRNSPVLRKIPESLGTFRSLNIVVQYIDLYVSTISRLLVMPVITSGTLNSFGTSKLNKIVIVTLSVRTLRVRELCGHDRDTSLVNNQ